MKAKEYYGTALCPPWKYLEPYFENELMGNHSMGSDMRELLLKKNVKPLPTLLDIGSGPGTAGIPFFKDFGVEKCIRVDTSPEMLEYARQIIHHPTITFTDLVLDVEEKMLDIPDCSVDIVLACYILPYVSNYGFIFKEMARVISPGKFLTFDICVDSNQQKDIETIPCGLDEPEYHVVSEVFLVTTLEKNDLLVFNKQQSKIPMHYTFACEKRA